jgi:hypothetical protein
VKGNSGSFVTANTEWGFGSLGYEDVYFTIEFWDRNDNAWGWCNNYWSNNPHYFRSFFVRVRNQCASNTITTPGALGT